MKSFFSFLKKIKPDRETGIIGRYYENDLPVIVSIVNKLPEEAIRKKYSFLVVVSWKYDGNNNNGMPSEDFNEKMMLLEDALEDAMNSSGKYVRAYARTGNHLKELVYYCTNQEDFMNQLNQALVKHERYPIEINFYEDPDWIEYNTMLKDFKKE